MNISDKIDSIELIDPIRRNNLEEVDEVSLFAAKHYVLNDETKKEALKEIREELEERLKFFEGEGKLLEPESL
jgi:excinuclease ABC subunit B